MSNPYDWHDQDGKRSPDDWQQEFDRKKDELEKIPLERWRTDPTVPAHTAIAVIAQNGKIFFFQPVDKDMLFNNFYLTVMFSWGAIAVAWLPIGE